MSRYDVPYGEIINPTTGMKWKRCDIPTHRILELAEDGKFNLLHRLCDETGAPWKVVIRALERDHDADLLEYGVSINSSWLTEKGRDQLSTWNNIKSSFSYYLTKFCEVNG